MRVEEGFWSPYSSPSHPALLPRQPHSHLAPAPSSSPRWASSSSPPAQDLHTPPAHPLPSPCLPGFMGQRRPVRQTPAQPAWTPTSPVQPSRPKWSQSISLLAYTLPHSLSRPHFLPHTQVCHPLATNAEHRPLSRPFPSSWSLFSLSLPRAGAPPGPP